MKRLFALMLVLVSVAVLSGCKGGDAPSSDTPKTGAVSGTPSEGKGGPGFDRDAMERGLKAVERMAAQVKKMPRETRENIVKQTMASLRRAGKYREDDLKYYEKKLRELYGL